MSARQCAVVQAGYHSSHLGEATFDLVREGVGTRLVAAAARLGATKKSDVRVAAFDPKAAGLQQVGDWDEAFQDSCWRRSTASSAAGSARRSPKST